jgi:CxxC motif-containing protein
MHCIVCPVGCFGRVNVEEGKVTDASGFICKRGIGYAEEEINAPKRVLTTTVRIINGVLAFLPVVSSKPIPKKLIMSSMEILKKVKAVAPVKAGDIIYSNILDLGIDMIASRDLDRRSVSVE